MDAQVFWNVIGQYNQHTVVVQVILLVLLVIAVALSYAGKVAWAAKAMLGIVNFFIGIVFFGYYGTQPIQTYFALPLYILCGLLFLYECVRHKTEVPAKPDFFQIILLLLYGLYPLISVLLGNRFPQMVTHIMPCPVACLSMVVYAGYRQKNKILLALLTLWGLTGVKSVIFAAYEDLILLICGIYGVYLLVKEFRCKHA